MAVADLQCRFDCLHTHIIFQCHGAEPNGGNAGAMRFNHLHYNLLEQRLRWPVAGCKECPVVALLPTGVPPGAVRCWCGEKYHENFSRAATRNTLNSSLFASAVTLE